MATHSVFLLNIPWTEELKGHSPYGVTKIKTWPSDQHKRLHFRSHNRRQLFDLENQKHFWKAIRRVTECLASMLWLVLRRLVWLILWSEALALTEESFSWELKPSTQGVSLSPWIHLSRVPRESSRGDIRSQPPGAGLGHVDIWRYIEKGFTNSGLLWLCFIQDLIWAFNDLKRSGCRAGLEDMWVPWLTALILKTPAGAVRLLHRALMPDDVCWTPRNVPAAQGSGTSCGAVTRATLNSPHPPSLCHFLPSTFLLPVIFCLILTQLNL